jgi:hypothetical protein
MRGSDTIERHSKYNAGEEALNHLAGYSLTDDSSDKSKNVFPNHTLSGGRCLVDFFGVDRCVTLVSRHTKSSTVLNKRRLSQNDRRFLVEFPKK